jgi:hypothetical protein
VADVAAGAAAYCQEVVAPAQTEEEWRQTRTGPYRPWREVAFEGVEDREGAGASAPGATRPANALIEQCEELLNVVARRFQAGPIYPPSGPPVCPRAPRRRQPPHRRPPPARRGGAALSAAAGGAGGNGRGAGGIRTTAGYRGRRRT